MSDKKTIKELRIYLTNAYKLGGSLGTVYNTLDEYYEAFEFYKSASLLGEKIILETTCLAALNFDNLKYFDKIIVYGKDDKKLVFELESDTSETMSSLSMIKCTQTINKYEDRKTDRYGTFKYRVGTKDIRPEKEIRVLHNLLNMILRGSFKDIINEDEI